MTYASEVLADSPLDFYQMETGTGTDSGSGSRTLTLANITSGVAGVVGNGWSYNGTSSLATMGTFPTITTAFTIEVWMKAPSAGGWTNDYPTAIRRDGTDIVLVRGRGSSLGVSPGEVDIYLAGTSILSGPAHRVDDGNWHHVVLSVSGNQAKLYIDKTLISTTTTSKSSYSFGTGTAYVGGGNTAALAPTELYKGTLDNVAIYNTALSATRIGAHYDAAPINVTIDVPTLTASADVYAATVLTPVSTTVDVSTVTASADVYTIHVLKGQTVTASIDRMLDNSDLWYSDSGSFGPLNSTDNRLYFRFVAPTDLNGSTVDAATFTVNSSATVTVDVQQITQDFDASGPTVPTVAAPAVRVTLASGLNTIDVSSILDTSIVYGFRITYVSGGPAGITQHNNPTTANRPAFFVRYEVLPVTVTIDVSTLTASAQNHAATAEGGTEVTVGTLTASLTAYDATVEVTTDPNVVIDVEALTASATAYEAAVVQSVIVDVDTKTASAQAYDATVEEQANVIFEASSPRSFFTRLNLIGAGSENNTNPEDDDFGPIIPTEDDDAYWQTVMNAGPDIWYRFNLISGTEETPRAYRYYTAGASAYDQPLAEREQFKGRHSNTVIGLNDGPNGRKNVHFNGTARFEQAETYSNDGEVTQPLGTLEFTMRTDKQNQFLMRMDDKPPADSNAPVLKDIFLENGKLKFMIYTPSGNTFILTQTVTAKTNLADGKWHHIALVSDYNSYFNVYVDGRLDIRRSSPPVSFPDFIGGYLVASGLPWYAEGVPSDKWYVGDMTEVVYYHRALSQDEIFRLNDTMYGYDPVYAEPTRATTNVGVATVETNIKRVLTVNLGGDSTIWQRGEGHSSDTFGEYVVGFSGLNYSGTDLTHSVVVNGLQFFSVNALFPSLGNNWKDDVTDMPRLVDLTLDVNLEDYDIVTFVNVPSNPNEWEALQFYYNEWAIRFGGPSPVKQIENMFAAAKQYALNGGGLFITDPFTAQAIGMIDRFDWVDLLVNDENLAIARDNDGSHDLHSAKISPWGYPLPKAAVTNPRVPPYELQSSMDYDKLEHYYTDEHSNTWQTVRTLVDGLTDIPGRVLTDAVWAWPDDLGSNGDSYALKTEERSEGLSIGDTFKIHGSAGSGQGDWGKHSGIPTALTARVFGQVATPLSHLKAGEAVTTFAPTYYDDDTVKPNPYKDYVLSAVVRPGDVLDGQIMHGRIYMNFSEGYMDYAPYMWTTPVDQIPADEDMPEVYFETAESREWTYSMWRGSWAGTPSSGGNATSATETYIDSNGNEKTRDASKSGGLSISGLTYSHRWPVKNEDQPQMAYRGLTWLGSDADADGNATVGVDVATATASAHAATVDTQKATDVYVGTVQALAEAWNDLDTEGQDVVVNVFTLTAKAQAEPLATVIEAEPLNITVTAWPDADGLLVGDDVVVLRLPTPYAILTLEDN